MDNPHQIPTRRKYHLTARSLPKIPIPSLDEPSLDGTLVPPWYYEAPPNLPDMFLATFIWGFTIAIAVFSGAKAVRQTYRSWRRSHKINAYIVMVWLEWASCVITTACSWLFLENIINPSVWYFTGMLVMWTFQIQCLMQIMTNRIGLILYNPDRARRLKWAVALAIGVINVSVFCIWVPARLQISETFMRANEIWDRTEKCIFLVIDGGLNCYFMYLIKSKLVANGLTKYCLVYRFNLAMVVLSLSLDAAIIGLMSLPDDDVYVQLHPTAYLVKLHIEMNIAELLGKVLKRSNHRRNSLAARTHSYDNSHFGSSSTSSPAYVSPFTSPVLPPSSDSHSHSGHRPSSGGAAGSAEGFHGGVNNNNNNNNNKNRERRLLSLEAALLGEEDDLFDFRCEGGGIHRDWLDDIAGSSSNNNKTRYYPGNAKHMDEEEAVGPKEMVGCQTAEMAGCCSSASYGGLAEGGSREGGVREQQIDGTLLPMREVRSGASPIVRPDPVHRKDSAWSATGTVSSCMTEPISEASGTSNDRDSVATI